MAHTSGGGGGSARNMGRQEVGWSRLATGSSGRRTRQSGFVRRHVVEGGGTTRLLLVIAAPIRARRVSVDSLDFEPPRPWTGTCVFISSAGASFIGIGGESSVFRTIYLFFVSGPRADGDKQNRATASAVDCLCFIGPGKSGWNLLGTQDGRQRLYFIVMAVFLMFLDQQPSGVTDDAEQFMGSG